MPTFLYQYRREQRAEFEIESDCEKLADALADEHIQTLELDSRDDTSDDPGELELLEVIEDDEEDEE